MATSGYINTYFSSQIKKYFVGIGIIGTLLGDQITAGNLLTDYSYINAGVTNESTVIARCLTGLGPSHNDDNNVLGAFYFNGNQLPNGECMDYVIQPNGGDILGVIDIFQCGTFSITGEGVYTCIIMNSSVTNQSLQLGIYFTGRSKSVYRYIPYRVCYLSTNVAAPVIDTPSSSNITVGIGSTITLSCISRGSPPDIFTWRKDNGRKTESTSITAVDHTSTSAVFRANYSMDNVTTSDSGMYTCAVTNPIGSDNANFTVTVIGMF